MKFVILIGAPGAGKGTQAKILAEKTGLPQIATGDIFRHNLKNNTELGNQAKPYMERGELVPDTITIAMFKDRLSKPDCKDGAILDGFPRSIAQAKAFDQLVTELDATLSVVAYLKVSQDILVDRLLKRAELEGRADDNAETIRNRMRVYEEQTFPVLSFYKEKGIVAEISGEQPIETVQSELYQAVSEKLG